MENPYSHPTTILLYADFIDKLVTAVIDDNTFL